MTATAGRAAPGHRSTSRQADDSTLWTGSIPLNGQAASDIRFVVQAVNGVGLVTMDDNEGQYYSAAAVSSGTTQPPQQAATSLQLTAPASAVYGSSTPLSAVLTSGGAPLPGQLVTFGIGSQTAFALTDATGRASVSLPLLGLPGSTTVSASFAGTVDDAGSGASAAFTVTVQPTTLTLAPTSVTAAQGADTGIVATLTGADGARLGQRTIVFVIIGSTSTSRTVITDLLGRAPLGKLTLPPGSYTVSAYFDGAITTPFGTFTLSDPAYGPSTATPTATVQIGTGPSDCPGVANGRATSITVGKGVTCNLTAGTVVSGNVTVQAGGTLIDHGATIAGNVSAAGASAVRIDGGGSISGNVTIQGLTGALGDGRNAVCNTSVKGNVQVQSNGSGAPVDIGNVGSCSGGPALTVAGNLQAKSNAGVLRIGGNSATGNIDVESNTGGGTLAANAAKGNCTLKNDVPAIVGSSNTVGAGKTNTCNASA